MREVGFKKGNVRMRLRRFDDGEVAISILRNIENGGWIQYGAQFVLTRKNIKKFVKFIESKEVEV